MLVVLSSLFEIMFSHPLRSTDIDTRHRCNATRPFFKKKFGHTHVY